VKRPRLPSSSDGGLSPAPSNLDTESEDSQDSDSDYKAGGANPSEDEDDDEDPGDEDDLDDLDYSNPIPRKTSDDSVTLPDEEYDPDTDEEDDVAARAAAAADGDDEAIEELDGDDEDADSRNAQAQEDATKYAMSQPAAITAYAKAQKQELDEWKRAADTFKVPIADLKDPKQFPEGRIPLRSIGLRSGYGLYPHQFVGGEETFINVFGPRRSMIQGDDMGYGKTTMVMMAWDMNFRAVAQLYHAGVKEGTPKLHWPKLENGQLLGCTPREGALFVSASANGIEVWVKTFVQMFSGDAYHSNFTPDWNVKIVILHRDGPGLVEKYGGAKNGVYSSMTQEEWAEIVPAPDWSKGGRPVYGQGEHANHVPVRWDGDSSWKPHPRATTTKPSPTSTRFIIVSTRESWRNNVGSIFVASDLDTTYRTLEKEKDEIARNKRATRKLRDKLVEMNKLKGALFFKKSPSWPDGSQPMQAVRKMVFRDPGSSTPDAEVVFKVVQDLRYASWVVVDELHMASGPETITYHQIIDPFKEGCGQRNYPGILGITGTALQNGAGLLMTFANKVSSQVCDYESNDQGVEALHRASDGGSFNPKDVFQRILEVYCKPGGTTTAKKEGLKDLPNISKFNEVFAAMLQFFLISRDSTSKDPWGQPLTILKCELFVEYRNVVHTADFWAPIRDAESKVYTSCREIYAERLAVWKEKGCEGPMPERPSLGSANPNAYMAARLISCFPNLGIALHNWLAKHPGERVHFLDDDGTLRLGQKANRTVHNALKSEAHIKKSFIWEIAEEACRGAEKVRMVVAEIERLKKERTKAQVQTKDGPRDVEYRSKFGVTVGLRLGRALLWAYLCQRFSEDEVVGVANRDGRVKQLPKWQRYWDPAKEEVDDRAFILVAALKVISQSVTLIECHNLWGLDPAQNNNDAAQAAKRHYRIGQKNDCIFVWLTTVNPTPPSKKRLAANPNAVSNLTIESRMVAKNKGKQTFFEDMSTMTAPTDQAAERVGASSQQPVDLTEEQEDV
jgi:hypothetical protein